MKKTFSLNAVAALGLALCGASCAPQTTNPEQLRAIQEQNAALQQEISKMQALIEQAGEDVPNLAEQIAAKDAEVASRITELDELSRQEADRRIRAIELQDRLDAFRSNFRMMQDEIANRQKS